MASLHFGGGGLFLLRELGFTHDLREAYLEACVLV